MKNSHINTGLCFNLNGQKSAGCSESLILLYSLKSTKLNPVDLIQYENITRLCNVTI